MSDLGVTHAWQGFHPIMPKSRPRLNPGKTQVKTEDNYNRTPLKPLYWQSNGRFIGTSPVEKYPLLLVAPFLQLAAFRKPWLKGQGNFVIENN
jgi:hypothetical protein